jgi:hypothetical protein
VIVAAAAVAIVEREHKIISDFGEACAAKISLLERVRFHHGGLPGLRVKQHQRYQVHTRTLVGLKVDLLAVFVESDRLAALKHVAGVYFGELVAVHAKDFSVAVFGGAAGQAQIALEVKIPAGDTLRVLAHQRLLAGGDLQLVKVMPRLVAVIEADVDHVRIAFRNLGNEDAYALQASEVARGWSIGAGSWFGCGIHGIDVIVFVTVIVFHVEHGLAVPGPEKPGDGPLALSGQQARRREWLVHALDVDVACVFPGFQERHIFSVGRELGCGDFRVTENQLTVNDGRKAACGGGLLIFVLRHHRGNEQGQAQYALQQLIHGRNFLSL